MVRTVCQFNQLKKVSALLALTFFLMTNINAQVYKSKDNWVSDKDLKSATLSYCVINANTGVMVDELNAHTFVVPASTQKAITTSAALGILGLNYRYETKIYFTGNFNNETGLLNGDVLIIGSGDPTLQSEYFYKDTVLVTDKWAKVLKEKGLKEIKGKVIGDGSCFTRQIPANWIWGDISNYFGAAPCGLTFSDNKFKLLYNSGAPGSKAILASTKPNYSTLQYSINSQVICKGTEDDAFVTGDPFGFKKEVNGKIPPNKTDYEVEAVLPDPALLCAEKLVSSLQKVGVKLNPVMVSSVYQKSDSLVSKTLMYSHYSPGLEKIVFHTNLKSNNLYAESILLTLGKGSIYAGIEAVKNYWQKRGLDVSELYMSDGSGLSRANTVTTFFQSSMLAKIYKDSLIYKAFNNSLPVAGKSGSMSNIGKGTLLEGNMRAKTGYINRARGYCGYVTNKKGECLAFSILFNNYNCNAKEAKLKIEKWLVELGE
jgi:D-alanyl-D-alanine carboxypeptidase/D-alanyl-D-alanine-endopeptidase (penicillin-binding protein 4)